MLRCCGMYNNDLYVTLSLSVMWLGVVGAALLLLVPGALTATSISITDGCTISSFQQYAGTLGLTAAVYNTIVFLAMSWRLVSNADAECVAGNVKTFLTGKYLPRFSRALLRDDQLCYLFPAIIALTTGAMFFNPRIPITYRIMFAFPTVMLTNAMTCLVFRKTKFAYNCTIVTTSELFPNRMPTLLSLATIERPRSSAKPTIV
ncbi:hypothetical protein MVEN_01479300 [Mycena venus]|uniref:Uncharacterized protein n=1 Tax=Mycena venus TaxID=2733690 RepID=A0A8H6XTJ0_9AGAR|nr:hypothetical protein MVEN_01479300 [Mycena venus]